MKKLLIIGAGVLQLPAIKEAKSMGLEVAVADRDPKAPGVAIADEFFEASTTDIAGIINVAEKYKPDGIMTLATDMPVLSIAHATERLGLPGLSIETAQKATNKGEMIKCFNKNNVPCPWYYIVKSKKEFDVLKTNLKTPYIIKPTDNSGSRGVILVNSVLEVDSAYEYSMKCSRSGEVIIEEYMQGPEVSVETFAVNGKVHVLAITDKITTGAPNFVELGHSQNSVLEEIVLEKVRDVAIQAIQAIGIGNGPGHVEIIVTDNGPKMVELGARMGGDCITSHLLPLSTGVNMIKSTIELALGMTPDISIKFSKGSAIRFITSGIGILKNITGVEETKSSKEIVEVVINKEVGSYIEEVKSSVDRIGYIITQSDSAEIAVQRCEEALKKIKVEVG